MAYWLVRARRVPMVIVELKAEAKQRLVRREIRQAQPHSAEPAALHLSADEQPARASLRLAAVPRTRLARQA
jgi:hypothetical protein